MEHNTQLSEEQRAAWVRDQYQAATKFLANKGLVTDSVSVEESRYIDPLVAVWKLKTINNQWFWVICGDLPSDNIAIDVATDAKEAMRHFSMKWQLQAETILQNGTATTEQKDYAQLLISRAEGLYTLLNQKELWGEFS
jgi:hypothetical protein